MKVGVPKEVKNHEYRVAITPIGVHELTSHGHEVYIQKDAGVGSSIDDAEYARREATLMQRLRDVREWRERLGMATAGGPVRVARGDDDTE